MKIRTYPHLAAVFFGMAKQWRRRVFRHFVFSGVFCSGPFFIGLLGRQNKTDELLPAMRQECWDLIGSSRVRTVELDPLS